MSTAPDTRSLFLSQTARSCWFNATNYHLKKLLHLDYIPEHRMLIVPTLDRTVLAYRWD